MIEIQNHSVSNTWGGKVTKEELWWKIFDCPYKGKCNIPKDIFPAPFFVGDNYERVADKVLFIAQNPGWPHYKVKKNNDYNEFPDYDYIEIQKNLTHAGSKYKDNFYFLMQTYAWELRVDNVWRGLIKSGIKAQLKNIAYTNLVKCPIERKYPTTIMQKNCSEWIIHEIDVLKPRYIVFLGKLFNYYSQKLRKEIGIIEKFVDKHRFIFHPSGQFSGSKNLSSEMQQQIAEINTWLQGDE